MGEVIKADFTTAVALNKDQFYEVYSMLASHITMEEFEAEWAEYEAHRAQYIRGLNDASRSIVPLG